MTAFLIITLLVGLRVATYVDFRYGWAATIGPELEKIAEMDRLSLTEKKSMWKRLDACSQTPGEHT